MAGEAHKDPAGATGKDLSPRLPDTYLLIAAVGLLVFLAGYVVAPGQFQVQDVIGPDGRVQQLVDPGSFRYADERQGAPLFSAGEGGPGLFNAVYEGLVSGSRDGGAVGIIAFILNMNGLVEDNFVLSNENFTSVRLPNEANFIEDPRPDGKNIKNGEPCMTDCKPAVKLTMRARILDVTPKEGAEQPTGKLD